MTLIIPIFLMMYWIGLLDTLTGVILVIAALELPFAIFVMKGFFDAVPWDIEMSAMTDGASRRQAFLHGRAAAGQDRHAGDRASSPSCAAGRNTSSSARSCSQKSNWTMSLYLFWMRDDVMGTDYAMVSAMGVFYVLPSVLLYAFTQKYLTQMTIGGIKG